MAGDLEKKISVKYALDSTGFNQGLQGINSNLKQNQASLKLASEGINTYGKNANSLKNVQSELTKQLDLQKQKMDLFKDSIDKTTFKMQENITKRDVLKKSLDDEKKKYDEVIKQYGKESDEAKKVGESIDKLTEEYKKKEKAVENNAKSIGNYTTKMTQAETEMVKTQGQLNKINGELDKSNNKWIKSSESLQKASEGMKNVGSKVSSVGDGILKATAPLVAFGVAGSKMASEFEDNIAKVSTISNDAEVPIGELRNQIIKLSNDSGVEINQLTNTVYDALSAGQKTGDVMGFVEKNTRLAKAGFAGINETLDLTTTIMNSYGLEAKEIDRVSNVLITTQNLGKTTVAQLSTSMGKAIPTANAFGVNLEQLATGMAVLTAKGIATAESTTYISSMLNELGKSGTQASNVLKNATGKSFQDLMKDGKSLGDVLASMDDYAKKNGKSLADMFGSAEAGKAGLVLATNAGQDFNKVLADMNNSAGATDQAFEKVSNTGGEKFRKSLNKLKNDAIKLGDALAPVIEKVGELISVVADKLGNLSKEQLENISKWTLMAVGIGGFAKVAGGAISTIGTIAGGISKLTGILGTATVATEAVGTASVVAGGATGLGAVATGLGSALVACAPFALAIAGVGVACYGIHKTMSEEVVPSIDLFADKVETTGQIYTEYGVIAETTTTKISDSTKKAVGAYMELDKTVSTSLFNMSIAQGENATVTETWKNDIVGKYSTMAQTIKDGLKTKQDESLTDMQTYFNSSNVLTTEEETKIVETNKQSWETRKTDIDNANKEINTIISKAYEEHRNLKDEEVKRIKELQDQMKTEAVKSLSDTEIEAKVILERIKSNSDRLTAEQASEAIKNANEIRDKTVKATEEEYDGRLKWIIKQRDELGTISTEQAQKLIDEAERTKKDSIEKAEEMNEGIKDKIQQGNSGIWDAVDRQTGGIKDRWDKIKDSIGGFFTWIGNKISDATTNLNNLGNSVPVDQNWTGTNHFQGGYTTMHERGFELYSLPRSSRIYNHEASEALVKQTAESVAHKVATSVLSNFQGMGNSNQNITIEVPVVLDGREVARATGKYMNEELNYINNLAWR